MLGLKPIQLLPARERVASALRKAILTRQISEGEVLTLDNTAKELGISITPVREAFQILARDGLIELKQNKGAVVLGINEHTLREHYQIRAVLEGAACAFCCETNADLTGIQNCLDTAAEALAHQDSSHYADLNQSFHYEIWKASGNTKLNNLLGGLWNGLSIGLQSTELEYANKPHSKPPSLLIKNLIFIFTKCRICQKHLDRSGILFYTQLNKWIHYHLYFILLVYMYPHRG